jgi:hypothetical protein
LTVTSFQNRLFMPLEAPIAAAFLSSLAFFRRSACLRRLCTRAIGSSLFLGPWYSLAASVAAAEAVGAGGGGPVPTMGATSAGFCVVEEMTRAPMRAGSLRGRPSAIARSGSVVAAFIVVCGRDVDDA